MAFDGIGYVESQEPAAGTKASPEPVCASRDYDISNRINQNMQKTIKNINKLLASCRR